MEEMSKDELIAMFHKVRAQTMQLAKEKKQAVENFEAVTKEREDIRSKALVIIQRCKDLEEKQAMNGMFKTKCESYAILFEEQTQKIADYENRLEENAKTIHRLEGIVSSSPEVSARQRIVTVIHITPLILFRNPHPLSLDHTTRKLTSKVTRSASSLWKLLSELLKKSSR